MSKTVRVGIIGASATGGWARDSHVPAVQALNGLELAAVATNGRVSADAAASAFEVTGYASGQELVQASDVDLVAVCARVPDHRDLVLAALAAGKHVYCEWPLGRSVAEAEEMAAAARTAGVRAAVGLQLRGSAVVKRVREILVAGRIGRILSASFRSSTVGFGPKVPAQFLYLEDPHNFANLVTIQGAHTIDLALADRPPDGDKYAPDHPIPRDPCRRRRQEARAHHVRPSPASRARLQRRCAVGRGRRRPPARNALRSGDHR